MATVYITERLIGEVRSNIGRMRDAEIRNDYPKHGTPTTADGSELFKIINWGEHLHLFDLVPKEWMQAFEQFEVVVHTDANCNQAVGTVTFTDQKNILGHPKSDYWNARRVKLSVDKLAALPDSPGVLEVRARMEELNGVKALRDKWTKIETDVVDFLRKCKSLNEALKLLPTIRMYVSKEDIQRVEHKPAPTKVRREELAKEAPDAEELTAAAMAARLSGAFA